MRNVGLVGGISWVSTMDYYKMINLGINEKRGGLHFAECLIYSLDFGAVQEVEWVNAFEILYRACDTLKMSGVEAIALCANTAHLFADELQERMNMPFIHIGTETAKKVEQAGVKKVALLGTSFTMEMEFYKNKLSAYGIEVIIPNQQSTRDFIQLTIKEELGRGIVNQSTKDAYITIVKKLVDQGAEALILGCTELPIIVSQADFEIPVFDTTKIHAEAIVDYMNL